MSASIPDLVFDFGLHRGEDTEFYLRKGFRVVALEARPDFCAEVSARFAAEVEAGRLTVVPCALYPRGGETVSFWVNPVKDDWNSVSRDFAAKEGHAVTEIRVPTVTLGQLFDRFGVPRYLKCDIEGMDEDCARQLLEDGRRPDFVSMEASSFDIFAYLRACGYDRAQLVNQALHWGTRPPEPARGGRPCRGAVHRPPQRPVRAGAGPGPLDGFRRDHRALARLRRPGAPGRAAGAWLAGRACHAQRGAALGRGQEDGANEPGPRPFVLASRRPWRGTCRCGGIGDQPARTCPPWPFPALPPNGPRSRGLPCRRPPPAHGSRLPAAAAPRPAGHPAAGRRAALRRPRLRRRPRPSQLRCR
ncbi:FkbM family methyltransferase [Dankookia sp. P2]|uniref:FkbM family methyltransferase n=1 Tax=Dankookia sp. P2 TaxID=3423955 RepID=UPI003D669DF0